MEPTFTPDGVHAFVTLFHEAAAKGVENATVRAFNATTTATLPAAIPATKPAAKPADATSPAEPPSDFQPVIQPAHRFPARPKSSSSQPNRLEGLLEELLPPPPPPTIEGPAIQQK